MEAITHIYTTYAKEKGKQVFALGLSKGAHHLTNVLGRLGDESFITAACVVQCPMKLWETVACQHS